MIRQLSLYPPILSGIRSVHGWHHPIGRWFCIGPAPPIRPIHLDRLSAMATKILSSRYTYDTVINHHVSLSAYNCNIYFLFFQVMPNNYIASMTLHSNTSFPTIWPYNSCGQAYTNKASSASNRNTSNIEKIVT